MTFIVNNDTNTNIILSIDHNDYLITANDHDLVLKIPGKCSILSVKREKRIPPPQYAKMLLCELLGIAAILFIKPLFYVLDISTMHKLNMNNDCVTINIVRNEKHPDRVIYDAITVESPDSIFESTTYHVENRKEVTSVYNKCKKVVHFWLYAILEFFFTLMGILITYPLLLAIYVATKATIVKIMMIIVPFFMIAVIALIGILPLHFLFKTHNKNFYRSMENNEISRYLKNQ